MSGWRRLLGRTPSPADAASPEPALAELQRELEVAHAIDEERRRIYDDLPDPPLHRAQGMHLFRIGRESVTNAMRHAPVARLRVVVARVGHDLFFEVTDDGHFDPARIGEGRGTRSMLSRAGELHGDISWQAGTQGGTKVLLRFPLPAEPPAAAGSPPRDGQGSMPR